MPSKLSNHIKKFFSLKIVQILLLLAILVIFGMVLSSVILKKSYPIGEDAAIHTNLAIYFLDHNDYYYGYYHYPPLFHVTVGMLSKLLSIPVTNVISIIQSILPSLIGLVWFCLAWVVTKKLMPSILATLIFLFASNQPMQTLFDGGIPNVINSAIIIPILLMIFLTLKDKTFNMFQLVLPIFFTILLVLTHHVSIIYWVIIYSTLYFTHKVSNNQKLLNIYYPILFLIIISAALLFPGWYSII